MLCTTCHIQQFYYPMQNSPKKFNVAKTRNNIIHATAIVGVVIVVVGAFGKTRTNMVMKRYTTGSRITTQHNTLLLWTLRIIQLDTHHNVSPSFNQYSSDYGIWYGSTP